MRSPRATPSPVYLDHHATTPCDPRVVDAMLPFLAEAFGNAASSHAWGRQAADQVEKARAAVARSIGCEASEIVFTSGATEANNLALIGAFEAAPRGRHAGTPHIVTQVTEHKAVLDACAELERRGCEVTYLPVADDGRIRLEDLRQALRDDTVLASIMWANNETGVVQPIAEIAELCRSRGVLVHTDAAQALTYEDCRAAEVDLMSLSGHKAYGPKGIGALYVRRRRPRVRLRPQMHGGGHERGRRSGTLDVPSIVGFGVACELVVERRARDREQAAQLRERLLSRLRETFEELQVNGSMDHRLPNNLNVSIPGLDAQALVESLDDVAISSGSACSSASQDGSYVLAAMESSRDLADSSLRFGLGRGTQEPDVDWAVQRIAEVARRIPQLRERIQECGVPS